MSKEWILNNATNRFQLNFKRNVGAVAEEIRKCAPKSVEDWKSYYFSNVYPEGHLEELGKRLFVKITEVLRCEIDEITEEDCIEYIRNLVIDRTYDGYTSEIETVYGQLEQRIGRKINPAPDKWDREYNVDFFIEVKGKMIGLQIKPVSDVSQITRIFVEREIQRASHEEFTKKYGGAVFYIYSTKAPKEKVKKIANPEVIEELLEEIRRLEG